MLFGILIEIIHNVFSIFRWPSYLQGVGENFNPTMQIGVIDFRTLFDYWDSGNSRDSNSISHTRGK